MTDIPSNQTITLAGMTPVTFAVLVTDLLHMFRPTGGTPADYVVTAEQLREFLAAGLLASTDVVDTVISTETAKPGSANQLRVLNELILALDGVVSGKLDASAYSPHYMGAYTNDTLLTAAHPTATSGDYAVVDAGVGQPAYIYLWDQDDAIWVQGGAVSPGTTDALVEGSTNLYFQAARAIAAAADAYVRYDEAQTLTQPQIDQLLDNLQILTLINEVKVAGQIRRWAATTDFYVAPNGGANPPNLVWYNQELFVVVQDFSSDTTFSEKDGLGNLVLRRVTMDTDLQYVELTVSGTAPLTVSQELGAHLCIRPMDIYMQSALPNLRLNGPETFHRAVCNDGIAGNAVVTIKRFNVIASTVTTVGDVTFDPTGFADVIPGVFTFNDAISPTPTTRIVMDKGDVLIFELTTAPVGLTWLRLTMLGTVVSFNSPYFNLPT